MKSDFARPDPLLFLLICSVQAEGKMKEKKEVIMGIWDDLAEILSSKKHSTSIDKKGKTIITTDNKGKTVFIDRTKDGGAKTSSAPYKKKK